MMYRSTYIALAIVFGFSLVFFDIYVAYLISKNVDFKRIYKGGLSGLNEKFHKRRLLGLVQKYTRAVSVKTSLIDRLQFRYIERLNIRSRVPGILAGLVNIYTVFLINAVLFMLAFPVVYKFLFNIPASIILSTFFSLIPYFILDFIARSNSERVRRKMADFISLLNRWIDVKDDIFYAFKKAVGFEIGKKNKSSGMMTEPLRTYIWDMLIQIEMGVDPLDALDNLDRKVDNYQFADFIINVKQIIKSRGNIKSLLSNMEDQYFKLEEEYNRRKISTLKDRVVIFISMFMTSGVAYYILKYNARVSQFYLTTVPGQILLFVFSLMFLAGLIISLNISTFKY